MPLGSSIQAIMYFVLCSPQPRRTIVDKHMIGLPSNCQVSSWDSLLFDFLQTFTYSCLYSAQGTLDQVTLDQQMWDNAVVYCWAYTCSFRLVCLTPLSVCSLYIECVFSLHWVAVFSLHWVVFSLHWVWVLCTLCVVFSLHCVMCSLYIECVFSLHWVAVFSLHWVVFSLHWVCVLSTLSVCSLSTLSDVFSLQWVCSTLYIEWCFLSTMSVCSSLYIEWCVLCRLSVCSLYIGWCVLSTLMCSL